MNIKDRRNYGILKDIYYTMGYNIDEVCDNLYNKLFNSKYKIKDVIKKIDVYGLGIQVPLLFHEINMSSVFELNNPMINDFYILSVLRNLKIIGIFTRLSVRDHKNEYLKLIPHAWKLIENRIENKTIFKELKLFLNQNFSSKLRKNYAN